MLAKTLLLGAFAALAAAQSAVLTFTRVPNPITDGEPQAILYATNDTQTPVTILLRRGSANNLQTVQTLTTDATGGQYIWTPPLSLPNGNDYALEIRQAGQNNYFGPFTVQGASPAAVASASSSASEASATSGGSSSVTGYVVQSARATNFNETTANQCLSSSMTTMGGANMTATGNSTMTMTGMSSGTGMSMPRNTTMASPTLSSSSSGSSDASSTANDAGTTTGAGFQETSSASPSSSDNAAASDFTGGKSTLAFVLGALAAVVYVH